HMTEVVRRC
nr:Chain P, Cellular tumor antigen p53 peptide [Homo sapiens]6VR1_Q Chain Q, Cellular tumor antigen p53 peptide [Homo sapiens]